MPEKARATAKLIEAITASVLDQRIEDAKNPLSTHSLDGRPLTEEIGHDRIDLRRNPPGAFLSDN
jgi:hypothetical protein